MRTYRGPAKPLVKDEALQHRFWSKVLVGGEGCWGWAGHRQDDGYGILEVDGTPRLAHRISFWLNGGSIDQCVLHRCDNPPCVRPSHLFAGTRRDNGKDRDAKGRTRSPIGEASGMAKLKASDIPEIRALLDEGMSTKQIGQRFGVASGTIRAIREGRTWMHVPLEPGE